MDTQHKLASLGGGHLGRQVKGEKQPKSEQLVLNEENSNKWPHPQANSATHKHTTCIHIGTHTRMYTHIHIHTHTQSSSLLAVIPQNKGLPNMF